MRPALAEGKVTTQHGDTRGAERIRQGCEKQRATICSCAVRQDQTVCPWNGRSVQESLNGRILIGRVNEFVKVLHYHSDPVFCVCGSLRLSGRFKGQPLHAPIQQFSSVQDIFRRARQFVNPAKLAGAVT
jgi:hypothetical protein